MDTSHARLTYAPFGVQGGLIMTNGKTYTITCSVGKTQFSYTGTIKAIMNYMGVRNGRHIHSFPDGGKEIFFAPNTIDSLVKEYNRFIRRIYSREGYDLSQTPIYRVVG